MKKKLLFIVATLLVSLVFVSCSKDEPNKPKGTVNINNILYRLNKDMLTAEVVGLGQSYSSQLTIPSTVMHKDDIYDVRTVAAYAFQNSGITALTIPASVISIGEYAIDGCMQLRSVKISDSPNSLTWNRFQIAESLIEIPTIYVGRNLTGYINTLPSQELTLGSYVTSLNINKKFSTGITIKSNAVIPPVISFDGTPQFFNNSKVYVPSSSLSSYEKAPVWKNFSNIKSI